MKCQYCSKEVDTKESVDIAKRIKRGDGIFHDECWKKEFIEKNAWKDDYMETVAEQESRWGEAQ